MAKIINTGLDIKDDLIVDGQVGIGTATPTAKLHVQGSGSTAATTSFLVENSVGTDLLIVKDDGQVWSNGLGSTISNTAFGQGIFGATFTGYGTTAFGKDALFSATSGYHNTAIGQDALRSMTTGRENVAIGKSAMQNGNPLQSVAIGRGSLQNATGSSTSVGIGHNALDNLTTGSSNVGIGYSVGAGTTGSSNTIVGWTAGRLIAGGSNNVSLGRTTLYNMTEGSKNVAIGMNSGQSNITGNSNVFLGYNSGYFETGSSKLFIDNQTRTDEATSRTSSLIYGEFNATVSSQILSFNASVGIGTATPTAKLHVQGSGSTSATTSLLVENSLGTDLLTVKDDGQVWSNGRGGIASNTAFGKGTLSSSTTGIFNTVFGEDSGSSILSADRNVALGFRAMYSFSATQVGGNNVAIGSNVGNGITSGISNVFIGDDAANSSAAGSYSVFLGRLAGASASGNYGVGIGIATLQNVTGSSNIAIGQSALKGLAGSTGFDNIVLGSSAMANATLTGSDNVAIGRNVAFSSTSNSRNVFIGRSSAQSTLSGNNNTYLGYFTGFDNVSGSNNVFLGALAGRFETGSEKLFIDNQQRTDEATARTSSLIYGEFSSVVANQVLAINASVGISGSATTTSSLNISNLPTSSAGLVAGDIWNNGGVLSIV